MNMFKKNGGFTLVELIVVIAILAILAGVAIPAYSGYITKAQDAAVITKLDAIQTAAQAANATAGAIKTIVVGTDGKVTVTAADNVKISKNFVSDFKLFYGEGSSNATITDTTTSIEVSVTAANLGLTGTSYANGATWNAATSSAPAGWSANPAPTGSGT